MSEIHEIREVVAHERLLTPKEMAELFRVDARTVTRWAKQGKIAYTRTPAGHRRYKESDALRMLEGVTLDGTPVTDYREDED